MAYSVTEAYNKAIVEADKMGSDYFTLPQFLVFFKTATYDFIGQMVKEIERNQTFTEDIKPLIVAVPIAVIADTDEANCFLAAYPSNHHTRLRVGVQYINQHMARMPRLEKHGEHNTNMVDPLNKPDKDYPLVLQMSDYYKIYPGVNNVVSKLFLTYVKHPTIGTAANVSGDMLNLPIQSIEKIIMLTVNYFIGSKGDPRAQNNFQLGETFRKPRD